jgi:sugar lactone lactonase YvrE
MDPVAWTPPVPTAFPPNQILATVGRIGRGLPGPESLAIDAEGRVHAGLHDGRIVRIAKDGSSETVADTGGRPLGIQFDPRGRLIVCDGVRGLLAVGKDGVVSVLTTELEGSRFGFADDLDIASDGTIYFSDASRKFGVGEFRNDAVEHRPNGRLLAHRPDGRTELVADELYFANGVALAADESFVLVTETWEYRVTRVWLTGERKGQRDVFAENLPGFPDNLTRAPSGDRFWLALFAPRNARLDSLAERPFLRKVMARLPAFLQPGPARHAIVLELDEKGAVLRSLQDPSPDSFSPITSALEHDGRLYLGSLWREELGVLTLQ